VRRGPDGPHDVRAGARRPARLLEEIRKRNHTGYVHLVGGPRTIETFRTLGALDKLGLIVIPFLTGEGMRLTPSVSADTGLAIESEQVLPTGAVELVYAVGPRK
jgi:hypothetical protein